MKLITCTSAVLFLLANVCLSFFSNNILVAQKQVSRTSKRRAGVSIDDSGPLKKVTINTDAGSEAEILTFGACVTSFKVNGYDSLFIRPDAKLDGSKPISGGLPHCFPQFGPGEIQQHGFARNLEWSIETTSSNSVTLKLEDSEETYAMWPHKFRCLYTVKLNDGSLATSMEITNTDDKPFPFQFALHSYFCVSDIDKATVHCDALPSSSYLDKSIDPPSTKTWNESSIKISQPIDYVFYDVAGTVSLTDESRKLLIKNTEGYTDTVVWSPYGNEGMGYKSFICVESAKVKPGTLQPQEKWIGAMELVPIKL